MMIEITVKAKDREINIAVNDQQVIRECVRILAENYVILNERDTDVRIYSFRKKEYIAPELSFCSAGILNGDILQFLYD